MTPSSRARAWGLVTCAGACALFVTNTWAAPGGPPSLGDAQRDPAGYLWSVHAQLNTDPDGSVDAMELGTGGALFAAHSPPGAIARVDADGTATDEIALGAPGSSFAQAAGGLFAATADPGQPGAGDVYARSAPAAWDRVLDGRQTSALVAVSRGELFALTGEPGGDGQSYVFDARSGAFRVTATLPQAVPTAAVEEIGKLFVGAGPAAPSGPARLFAGRRGKLEDVGFVPPGPAPGPGERQEVTAMLARDGVIVMGLATFDASGMPVRGQVILLAARGSDRAPKGGKAPPAPVVAGAFTNDAPTSLAFADGTVYAGTWTGRLVYHQSGGNWTDEPGLPINRGVGALRFDAATGTLFAGVRTTAGAQVLKRIIDTPLATPPAAPDMLTATAAGATQVDLAWRDNAADETGQRIERSPAGMNGFAPIDLVGPGVTSYSDTTASPDTSYDYRVFAVNAAGDSMASNIATATTPAAPAPPPAPTPPAAPDMLAASAVNETQVDLAWRDNAADETGHRVERSLAGANAFAPIDTLGPDAVSYSDTTAAPSTSYDYRVFAFNAVGDSMASNTATATTPAPPPPPPTPPAAPSMLTATATSQTDVDLAWNDNANDETGFRIERSAAGAGAFAEIASVGPDSTAFTDTMASPGTAYDYQVFAVNAAGDSAPSNVATATTDAPPPAPPPPPARTYLADVKPVLSGATGTISCNPCHESRSFRLSRGFTDDAADYQSVLQFIDQLDPARSEILRRATGNGHPLKCFDVGSAQYQAILEWVGGGAPFDGN